MYFPHQLYFFQCNVACETRLTENGLLPERNLRMVSLLY